MSKICMLVTNSVRKDPRVRKEAMSAYNAGHDVTVIGIKDQHYDQTFIDKSPYNIVLMNSINNSFRRFTPFWFIKGLIKTNIYNRNFIKEVIKINPDFVHSNDYDTLVSGYKASKRCKSKHVYDSHEIASGSILAEKYKLVKFHIKRKEGKIIRKAHAVITVSNASADYLKSLYRIQRPAVITNCPPYYNLQTNTKKVRNFDVLYQGIMSYGRGYEEFVQSAKYVDEGISYTIRGYGETKKELIELSEKEKVTKRIFFPEPVEINELIAAASKSMIGVVLTQNVCMNYNMTVSNKLFEYLQAGLPVILSNVPEHVYLNKKYNIGVVIEAVSAKKIAEAINLLYNDREMYNNIYKNVLEAKKLLSWERFEKRLLEIYQS